jgi:hypothetical protein
MQQQQEQQQYRQLPGATDSIGRPAGADQGVLVDGVKCLLISSTWEHKIGGLMAAKVCDIAPQRVMTHATQAEHALTWQWPCTAHSKLSSRAVAVVEVEHAMVCQCSKGPLEKMPAQHCFTC